MKSRLLILFLFGWLGCFGQVPNTATFSLTDVTNIVGGSNLTTAFANSVDALFDPAYKGTKTNLYNFRNYGAVVPPTVTTNTITNRTSYTATGGGNVTSDGGGTVTYRGVCWSTSHNPTTANAHTTDGTGTGAFTSSITGLSIGSTYYVRAYAINSAGVSFGSEVSFVAPNTNLPFVNGIGFMVTRRTSMDIQTYVEENGGGSVTEIGVCYSSSNSNPTTANSKQTTSILLGQNVMIYVTGLTPNTRYWFRAYAINSNGIEYSGAGFSNYTLP